MNSTMSGDGIGGGGGGVIDGRGGGGGGVVDGRGAGIGGCGNATVVVEGTLSSL